MTTTPPPITYPITSTKVIETGYCAKWTGTNGFSPVLPEEPTFRESEFPTIFEWNSETFDSDDFDILLKKVIDQTASSKVQSYTISETTTQYESGDTDSSLSIQRIDVGYTLKSLTITSRVPENGGAPWIYPDEFDVPEHPNHPKQYGGVVFFTEKNLPKSKSAGEYSTCGTDTGPGNDGIVYYKNDDGVDVPVETGYFYTDCFSESQFSYIPMNSGKTVHNFKGSVGANGKNRFKRAPFYPEVKDEVEDPAPIYPMDTITSFLPDGRPFVTVYHTVNFVASPSVFNGSITIKQTVFQDDLDYIEKLRALQGLCNWNNPGEWDKMSMEYPTQYPYTIVQDTEPTERQTYNIPEGPLEKGDVWYNPVTQERKYYYQEDEATSVILQDSGARYSSKQNVFCTFKERRRDIKKGGRNPIPYGLYVDIETYKESIPEKNIKKGQIKNVTINRNRDNRVAQHWRNNDKAHISGGNGQALVKIKVRRQPEWITDFVPVYHGSLNITKENDYTYD